MSMRPGLSILFLSLWCLILQVINQTLLPGDSGEPSLSGGLRVALGPLLLPGLRVRSPPGCSHGVPQLRAGKGLNKASLLPGGRGGVPVVRRGQALVAPWGCSAGSPAETCPRNPVLSPVREARGARVAGANALFCPQP